MQAAPCTVQQFSIAMRKHAHDSPFPHYSYTHACDNCCTKLLDVTLFFGACVSVLSSMDLDYGHVVTLIVFVKHTQYVAIIIMNLNRINQTTHTREGYSIIFAYVSGCMD